MFGTLSSLVLDLRDVQLELDCSSKKNHVESRYLSQQLMTRRTGFPALLEVSSLFV